MSCNRTAFPLCRRSISLLIAAVMAMCLIRAANAQSNFTCVAAAAVPPLLRSEGLGERVGDIVLTCTGGIPTPSTTNIPQANLTVSLNAPLTSRILGAGDASEALLFVDEPGTPWNSSPQLACTSVSGCAFTGTSTTAGFPGPEPYNGSPGPPPRPNIFEGIVVGNSVTFFGVPVDPPGGTGVRTFRVSNLRVNASSVPLASSGLPAMAVAQINVSGGFSFPIVNPQQVVGYVIGGMVFSLRTGDNQAPLPSGGVVVPACTDLNGTSPLATLRFRENFATALKPRTMAAPIDINTSPPPAPQSVPWNVYNSESGFYNPLLSGPNGQLSAAGLADFGTRVKVTFRNIPAGVSIWVTTTNLNPAATKQARLVAGESLPFAPLARTDTFFADMRQLAVNSGIATAVWEILAAEPIVVESFEFGVSVGGVPNPVGPAIITAAGSFAPAPPAFAMPAGGTAQPGSFPLPRFADLSVPANLLQTAPCSMSVGIVIKPGVNGAKGATINPGSNGRILVAVLSSAGFDAPARVQRASLTFGRSGTEHSLAFCNPAGQDVNRDGRPDLVCHFETASTGLRAGDTSASLKGITADGMPFSSTASIRTVP